MNYEILTEDTGLVPCVHNAISGVGRIPDERQVFKDILESRNIDYFICDKCVYIIKTDKYNIIFKDLKLLKKFRGKIYFKTAEGKMVLVTKENFSVGCYYKEPTCPDEAWIQVYVRKPRHT